MTDSETTARDEVNISPVPEWVVTHKVKNRQPIAGEPVTDLLFDRQVNEELRTNYFRVVYRVENSVGVDQCSRLSIAFSPERNRLKIHKIQIFRDGTLSDRTDEGDFKVLQREANLERSLSFDGDLTAMKMLYDIRPGDVIDYSYSIKSIDSIYSEGFSLLFFTQDTVPLGMRHLSWLTRNPDGLAIGGNHTSEEAEHEELDGLHRFTWHFNFENEAKIDNRVPSGILALNYLELSTFNSFRDIASLEQREWSKDESFDWKEVEKLIGFDECQNAQEKIEKAISWVLDNIRYQGIFVGHLALVPAPLAEVLKRRFGDCKENTALLVKILRSLGFEAWPALVSSLQRERIKDRLISPSIFDHAITCLKYEEELYWIDATDSFVERRLERFRRSDFGVALILSPETESLTEIPSHRRGDSEMKINHVVRLGNRDNSGSIESVVVAKGLAAESIKRSYANLGIKGLEETIQEELRVRFEEIEIKGGVNILEEKPEHFSIQYRAKGEAPLEALRVIGNFSMSESGDRSLPLALAFPSSVTEHFEIHNNRFRPERLEIPGVVTPYFQASKSYHVSKGLAEVTMFYETLAPEIPASAFPAIHDKLEEAANLVGLVDAIFVDASRALKKKGHSFQAKNSTGDLKSGRKRRTETRRDDPAHAQEVRPQRRRRSQDYRGPTRLSAMAVMSLISGVSACLIVVPCIFAVIFGHIALTKIKYDPSLSGRGMAFAGLILGYLILGVLLIAAMGGLLTGMASES